MKKKKEWICENCGRRRLEAFFKMWVDDKEVHMCYRCRKESITLTK